MGQPAARSGDMHMCPMVTPGVPPVPHVGGPILPPGAPTVLIGSMPAATLGTMCTCVGPPDAIIKGAITVMLIKKPAARMGDQTAHGGVITVGLPTVLIGESPLASAIGFVNIVGDDNFRAATMEALAQLYMTPTGRALLFALNRSGRTVTIKRTNGGNACDGDTAGGVVNADGTPGTSINSTISFNPDRTSIGTTEDWMTRPPGVALGHELIHSEQMATGTFSTQQVNNDSVADPANPGGTQQQNASEVQATGIPPYDGRPYTENKIRDEWNPRQPPRTHY